MTRAGGGWLALGLGVTLAACGGTDPVASQPPASPTPGPDIRLVDVAPAAGLTHRVVCGEANKPYLIDTNGTGPAVLDYDGDGWMDLYVPNGATPLASWRRGPAPNYLYRNRGDGTFEEVAAQAGVDDHGWASGALAFDYDNDGDSDLYVTNYGPNRLYRNDGDGTFTDVAAQLGLSDPSWSMGAAAADYDRDGDLDLYVAHYIVFDADHPPLNTAQGGTYECKWKGADVACGPLGLTPEADFLFRNDGPAGFTDVSEESGIRTAEAAFGMGVTWLDVNGDELPDIFVACDASPNIMLVNRGNGRFEDVGTRAGTALGSGGVPQSGMGVAVGDLDGDGHEEIVVTNFSDQENAVYRPDGQGFYDEVSALLGMAQVSMPFLGWGTTLFDVERDGDLDLFVANGHVFPEVDRVDPLTSYLQRSQLYLNQGEGFLSDHRGPGVAALERKVGGRGVARVDFDNDGDWDILEVLIDDAPVLLRNDTPARGGFVGVRLIGTESSRDPAQARVTVRAGGAVLGTQVLHLGSSYMGSEDPRLLFAVGDHAEVTVDVLWPRGEVESWTLAAGRYHELSEGTGTSAE